MRFLVPFTLFITSFVFFAHSATLPHQGRVLISGSAFEGTGLFRFALVNEQDELVWNHLGGVGVPDNYVELQVEDGFYRIRLGDPTVSGMAALPDDLLLLHPKLSLRIWFNDGVNGTHQLGSDQPLPVAASAVVSDHTRNQGMLNGMLSRISYLENENNQSLVNRIESMARRMDDLNNSLSDFEKSSFIPDSNFTFSQSIPTNDGGTFKLDRGLELSSSIEGENLRLILNDRGQMLEATVSLSELGSDAEVEVDYRAMGENKGISLSINGEELAQFDAWQNLAGKLTSHLNEISVIDSELGQKLSSDSEAFFSAFQALHEQKGGPGAASEVVEKAQSMVLGINRLGSLLDQMEAMEKLAGDARVSTSESTAWDSYKLKILRDAVQDFASSLATQVNSLVNPSDDPESYVFGFESILGPVRQGANRTMEETYGLFGVEGNGKLKLFDEEVEMTLPYAENETFSIVQSANILPKELEQGWDLEEAGFAWFRDGDNFGLQIDQLSVQSNFYAYARRMQHTTLDFDPTYPGEDKILTPSNSNNDDGRFLLRGYESIPFRIEPGSKLFLLGDNFLFGANLTRPDNLAATFRLDPDFTPARVQEIFAPIVDRRVAENPELNESLEIDYDYPQPWERLRANSLGEIVFYEGKIWEAQIDSNVHHRPSKDSAYWKEIPGGYSVPTQDWTLTDLGVESRIYFIAPDGRLFDYQLDALFHTQALLLETKIYEKNIADLSTDALAMVKEVTIPFRQFTAEGSGTRGVVEWDSNTQSYKLWAMAADQSEPVTGQYVKGNIVDSTNDPAALLNGSVALHEGRYFVVTDENSLDTSVWSSLNETNLQGGGASLLPNGLPKEGLEKTLLQGTGNSVSGFAGDIVFQRTNDVTNFVEPVDRYFLALNNYTNVSDLGNSPSFVEVNAFSAMQGSTWASNKTYDSGQIVYYKGSYYQARVDNLKNNITGYNALGNYQGQFTVFPDDDFYTNEYGELVPNTFWSPVGPSLQYVLSFTLRTGDYPKVSIASAGSNGMDAEAEPVLDASGKLIGLRVNNRGSYAFATGSPVPVPPEFRKAFILYEAQSAEIPIIWGSDSQTGNPQVWGFDLRGLSPLNLEPENVSHNLTFRLLRSHKAELTSHEDSSLAHAVALLDESAIVPEGFLGSAYFSEAKNQAAFDLGSLELLYPHAPGRTPTAPVEDMAKITVLEQQLEEALNRIDSLEAIIDGAIFSNTIMPDGTVSTD